MRRLRHKRLGTYFLRMGHQLEVKLLAVKLLAVKLLAVKQLAGLLVRCIHNIHLLGRQNIHPQLGNQSSNT
jgi:hypothetical protein